MGWKVNISTDCLSSYSGPMPGSSILRRFAILIPCFSFRLLFHENVIRELGLFRPFRAWSLFFLAPGLTPGAVFLRRFAALAPRFNFSLRFNLTLCFKCRLGFSFRLIVREPDSPQRVLTL